MDDLNDMKDMNNKIATDEQEQESTLQSTLVDVSNDSEKDDYPDNIKNMENMDDADDDYEIHEHKSKNSGEFLQWVKAILIAVVAAYLLKAFVFERAQVEGDSMKNTLHNEQTLIEYKLSSFFGAPNRGDIVVIEIQKGMYNRYVPLVDTQEVDYIKRVIGLPGETIDIENNVVYITNKEGKFKLVEPYIIGTTQKLIANIGYEYPYKIPDDSIFVMGDNRNNSSDSRVFGPVKLSSIRGIAVFRLSPFKDFGSIDTSEKKVSLIPEK